MEWEYYEDIELHVKHRSREYFLRDEEIVDYAKQWDPVPIHVDPEFAKASEFGGLFAPAVLLMAIWMKLLREKNPRTAHIVGIGWDEVRFLAPAYSGTSIVIEEEAVSKRDSSSRPNAGIVHYVNKLLDQQDQPVATFKTTSLVEKRNKI